MFNGFCVAYFTGLGKHNLFKIDSLLPFWSLTYRIVIQLHGQIDGYGYINSTVDAE